MVAKEGSPFRNLNRRGNSLPLSPLVSLVSVDSRGTQKAEWILASDRKSVCFSADKRGGVSSRGSSAISSFRLFLHRNFS